MIAPQGACSAGRACGFRTCFMHVEGSEHPVAHGVFQLVLRASPVVLRR